MKKLFTLLLIVTTLTTFGQKKDSVKYDTAFVFSVKEIESIKSILMESKVIVNGNQLTGKELQQLFGWIDSKGKVFKKEKPQ
jgi:hypothetical protein